ncbi:cyclin f-box [Fusarium pseudocircinatum]|uniref:Cyclin f-box n=1 Tax=Fusarium pseudocircinatum TaxID=56676 RepID=A0A8H5P1J9_9HYPO|nr:cyclin f-box [Fusarium pseudocircinatum]
MPRGYRSATEYVFDQEQADAIIRTSAYHRRDYGLSVIWFSPSEHINVRPSIATPFQRTSSVGLGSLDRLPLEFLYDTLFRLDIHSLLKFRPINFRSRQTVDSLKQYQTIVLHGMNLLCALLRTRLAVKTSLLDFYNALCLKSCSLCGEFGGFISLLTWTRCGFKCLKEAPETQIQTVSAVRKQFRLNKADLGQLRSFKTLPGIYSMEESVHKSRFTIVSLHQASLISGQQPQATGQVYSASSELRRKYNFMGSCALPYYDKLALEKDIIGARGDRWAFEARDKAYARDAFLEHFRWCEQAQLLWESSCEVSDSMAEMADDATANPLQTQPDILSMEVDDDNAFESEYQLRIGNQVKYLVLSPRTFDRDTLSFPIPSLPCLPCNEEWTVAHISRDKTSGELKISISSRTLAGVRCRWHRTQVDCLELEKTKQLTAMASEAISHSILPVALPPSATIIAKIARFEWELPRIEQETKAYQLLEGSELAPRCLGHIHENGRLVGLLIEKIEGRPASLLDLSICETALGKLHELGHAHGDVNRYNFLVTEEGVKLLDFECFVENASPESMRMELESLRAELVDESGRGGGFIFRGDSN